MSLTNLQAAIAVLLLGLAALVLPAAYSRAIAAFAPAERRWLWAATALAALLRWALAPKWLVTVYIGYLQAEQAIELQADSHYGLGSQALYHALFSLLPHDHRTIQWTNAVVAVAALPLWAGLCARLFASARAGLGFALMAAATPLFVKNDVSEANQVPALWWLAGGLVLWQEYFAEARRGALVGATVLLAFAMVGRPEMPVLALAAMAAVAAASADVARHRPWLDGALWGALAAMALLAAPHVLHVARSAARLAHAGGLDTWRPGGILPGLWRSLVPMNTLATPTLFPLGITLLALVGALRGGPGRARWAVLGLSLVAVSLYGLDLCVANMARVHVPGATFATMLAAAGAAALLGAAGERTGRVAAGLAVVVLASAWPSVGRLWAPTNEEAEEQFIREAVAQLPADAPFVLVRPALVDRDVTKPNSSQTHHHFPDYLVREPARRGRVASIRDWLKEPDWDVPAYFFAGMRCYALLRSEGEPVPRGDNLQPACAAMRERFQLTPVLERDVPNRGDVWLPYYGDASTLRLGLYRVVPTARDAGALAPSRQPRGVVPGRPSLLERLRIAAVVPTRVYLVVGALVLTALLLGLWLLFVGGRAER